MHIMSGNGEASGLMTPDYYDGTFRLKIYLSYFLPALS